MAAADNPRLPLTSATSSIVKYTEMRNPTAPPSTMISMTGIPPAASNPLQKQGSVAINDYELRRMPTQQRRFVKKTLMANVGYRLAKRKQLHIERYVTVDTHICVGLIRSWMIVSSSILVD
jgi:hypothetical protein